MSPGKLLFGFLSSVSSNSSRGDDTAGRSPIEYGPDDEPQIHARTKHIDTIYHFIQEQLDKKVVQFQCCPTSNMLADRLTKSTGSTTVPGQIQEDRFAKPIIVELATASLIIMDRTYLTESDLGCW